MRIQIILGLTIVFAFTVFYRGASEQLETHKQIRNELQNLSLVITDRIECVPLVYEEKAEIKVSSKKQGAK